ncbi:hypothetical protein [Ruminiclostridium cellobioparum]|uniref:hypothetical protein n=1 Tax=Ruminiclostridium cellobioparum TaxID=29355 RepID=UPI0012B5263F|nr:hypothetical protein [Ruminiclostridium cellobioparum]
MGGKASLPFLGGWREGGSDPIHAERCRWQKKRRRLLSSARSNATWREQSDYAASRVH